MGERCHMGLFRGTKILWNPALKEHNQDEEKETQHGFTTGQKESNVSKGDLAADAQKSLSCGQWTL